MSESSRCSRSAATLTPLNLSCGAASSRLNCRSSLSRSSPGLDGSATAAVVPGEEAATGGVRGGEAAVEGFRGGEAATDRAEAARGGGEAGVEGVWGGEAAVEGMRGGEAWAPEVLAASSAFISSARAFKFFPSDRKCFDLTAAALKRPSRSCLLHGSQASLAYQRLFPSPVVGPHVVHCSIPEGCRRRCQHRMKVSTLV
mmetsp:Transcript_39023/g.92139  ORF Transcript_39023/g.92139 Transcript_39023/m.92139 type:complete len:200 (-) Transcript_39023:421-1020(-)